MRSSSVPYPKMNNEAFVGIVVPERMRGNWRVVRESYRRGLPRAISMLGGRSIRAIPNSDKSFYGRQYAYPITWRALKAGGVFISDDIQDNMAFAEFVKVKDLPFAITESDGKYVGIAVKPG